VQNSPLSSEQPRPEVQNNLILRMLLVLQDNLQQSSVCAMSLESW